MALVCVPPGSGLDWMNIIIGGFLFYAECVQHLKLRLIKLLFVGCIDYTLPALVSLPFPHHYFCDQQGSLFLGSRGANVVLLVLRLVLLRQPFIISASFIDHYSWKAQGAVQTVFYAPAWLQFMLVIYKGLNLTAGAETTWILNTLYLRVTCRLVIPPLFRCILSQGCKQAKRNRHDAKRMQLSRFNHENWDT